MERRGPLARLIASCRSPHNAGDRLQGVMEAYWVSNSRELSLAVRTQIAREVYLDYKNRAGRPYGGGDFPTFGIWYRTISQLGPDAVAVCVEEGLISPKMFTINTDEIIIRLKETAKKEGWNQD